jgi:crotonobetainyl-CoA:carnitine CoA-transferase CaiB-like acyl-CoA transferase
LDGHFQPAPAPRFSLTKESVKHGPPKCGQDNAAISKKFKLDESKLS